MERFWSKDFYNPSAIYLEGLRAKEAVRDSRLKVARLTGVSTAGIIFTSGGTEANNLAILGAFNKALESIERPHLIVSTIEHSSIIATAHELLRRGGEVSFLEVSEDGRVSPEALKNLLRENTFLVSLSLANGEIGTIEPLAKVGRVIREYRKKCQSLFPYLHTDASQAANYLDLNLESLQADLLTLDSSKIYGPKGVGALVLRRGVALLPIVFGGQQEGGRRAGTENPALVTGFAKALEIAVRDRRAETRYLEACRQVFIKEVRESLPEAVINGSDSYHLPNIVNISLPGTISELVVLKLEKEGILASVGSACSYDERENGSPVIAALGREDLMSSSLRFSFGRGSGLKDIKKGTQIFCRVARAMLK